MKDTHEADAQSGVALTEESSLGAVPRMLAEATTLVWNLVLPIVGGALLGRYLDDRLGRDYAWTLSLLALGVLVAFGNLYTLYVEHGFKRKSSQGEEPLDESD